MATTSARGRCGGATRARRRRGAQPHIECAPPIGQLPARSVVNLDVWIFYSVDSQSESSQQESPINFRPNVQGFESISGGFPTFRRESQGSKIPIQFMALIKTSLRFDDLPLEPLEYSLSTNQGRGQTMDGPLANQGPYTFTNRICAKRARKSSQPSLSRSLSLDQSYEGLQR